MDRIARLELELTYYDVAFQHVSHYAMGTQPVIIVGKELNDSRSSIG